MADAKTWARRVAAWRASGETANAFAAGRGFAANSLRWWAWQLGRRERDAKFVRVLAADERVAEQRCVDPTPNGIEIDVDGVRVLVRAGFDREVLGAVVDLLRTRGRS